MAASRHGHLANFKTLPLRRGASLSVSAIATALFVPDFTFDNVTIACGNATGRFRTLSQPAIYGLKGS